MLAHTQTRVRQLNNELATPNANLLGQEFQLAAPANTKSGWTDIRNMAPLPWQGLGLAVYVNHLGTGRTDTSTLIDIGYGNGTHILIPDLMLGYTDPTRSFFFPISVPPTTLQMRHQSANTTRVLEIGLQVWGGNLPWHDDFVGSKVEAYGVNTSNSRGVAVMAGNDTYGAWTTIGTTSFGYKALVLSAQNNGNTSPRASLFFLAIRFGGSGGALVQDIPIQTHPACYMQGPSILDGSTLPLYLPVPAGVSVQVALAMSTFLASSAVLDVAFYGIR